MEATVLSVALTGFRSSLGRVLQLWSSASASASAMIALSAVNNVADVLELIKTCVAFSIPLTGTNPITGLNAIQTVLAKEIRNDARDCIALLLEQNVPIENTRGDHPLTTVLIHKLDFAMLDMLRCDVRGKASRLQLGNCGVANFALFAVRGGVVVTSDTQFAWAAMPLPIFRDLFVQADVDGRLLSSSFERAMRTSFGVDHAVHVAHENGDTVPISVALIRLLYPSFRPYDASGATSQLPKRFSAAEFRIFVELLMFGRSVSMVLLTRVLAGDDSANLLTARAGVNAQLYELAAIYLLGMAPLAPDATVKDRDDFDQRRNAVTDSNALEDYRRLCSSIAVPKNDNNDRRVARSLRSMLFAANRPTTFNPPSGAQLVGDELPEALRRSKRLAESLALDPAFSDDEEAPSPAALAVLAAPAPARWPAPDVVLVSNERRINAHRVILALRVPYFASRFSSAFADAASDEVALDDVTAEAMRAMVVFAYCGTVRIAADHVLDVLACAHRLHFVELQRYCERVLAQNLDLDNVCDVLPYALHYEARVLTSACQLYIATWLAFGADRQCTASLREALAALNDDKQSATVQALAGQLAALQREQPRYRYEY